MPVARPPSCNSPFRSTLPAYFLLQIGERLHEKQRGDVREVEGIEPNYLINTQALQGGFVEDHDRIHVAIDAKV